MAVSKSEDESFHVVYSILTVLKWELITLGIRDAERRFPEVCAGAENRIFFCFGLLICDSISYFNF
jgi:hypothetical protein